MKTKFFSLFILMCVNIASYGCATIIGSGVLKSETRATEEFNGIELRGEANVYVTQGDVQEIRIEADDNLLSHITTTVKNGSLVIGNDADLKAKQPVSIYVTAKSFCMLELSGSGNVITMNKLKCDHMSLRLSGSGDLRANIDGKSMKAVLSGSGNMELRGSASETDIRLSGSGNVNAKELNTFSSLVNITGSGNSTIDVKNDLTVNISGSGNVYYVQDPEQITSKIAGSGMIQKI